MKLFLAFFVASLAVVQAAMQANAPAVSSYMATQTNSNLAAFAQTVQSIRASASAALASASITPTATAKAGFGAKMKNFFKNLQGKIQKKKTAEATASAVVNTVATTAAPAPAAPVVAAAAS